jgi:hypothetical protein
MRIPTVPEYVCATHAGEFWTGLLAFAIARSDAIAELTGPSQGVTDSEFGPPAVTATVLQHAVWNAERAGAVVAA